MTSTRRKPPTAEEKLAAALLQLASRDMMVTRGQFETMKTMTPREIIACFELHHWTHVAIGGSNHPANMSWMLKADHRWRTAKIDQPRIAKTRRAAKRREGEPMTELWQRVDKAVARMKVRKLCGRPMPHGRKSPTKRTMAGKVVPR